MFLQNNNEDSSYVKGWRAETYAVWFLRLKGYSILARRYRVSAGEIDIIAKKRNIIAIVEVKRRNTIEEAMEAINWRGKKRIRAAAKYWFKQQISYNPNLVKKYRLRFDAILVCNKLLPKHLKNFF